MRKVLSVPSRNRRLSSLIVVGILVAAGAISATVMAVTFAGSSLSGRPIKSHYPSIDIVMPKTTYSIGERLNFTINTYGMCATPNVLISRSGGQIIVRDYKASPTHCPATADPKAGRPHFAWTAEQLQQTFSDEYFGGNGHSTITTNAAMTLKTAGKYTVRVSLLDNSDSMSKEFMVIEDGKGTAPTIHMNLTSLEAYTPIGELIGKVIPNMEFKKGEQVFFNATFVNPSVDKLEGIVLTVGIRDSNENPLPDDISVVTGDAAPRGTMSVQNSWMPEKTGDYNVMIFSLTQSDLKSPMIVGPVVVVPIRVVGG